MNNLQVYQSGFILEADSININRDGISVKNPKVSISDKSVKYLCMGGVYVCVGVFGYYLGKSSASAKN